MGWYEAVVSMCSYATVGVLLGGVRLLLLLLQVLGIACETIPPSAVQWLQWLLWLLWPQGEATPSSGAQWRPA